MTAPHGIGLLEATRVWARIALLSFGGPAGQVALMHRILVEEKRWIGDQRFLHALNFCMLLPGPEAQQLATYIGWLLHRTRGGLIAGVLFVLPGLVAIMALSWIYVLYGRIEPVAALFFGLKAAVLAIVVQAIVRIGSRALRSRMQQAVAAGAFVAIFLLDAPFPLIVLAAALIGFVATRAGSGAFGAGSHATGSAAAVSDAESALGADLPDHARARGSRSAIVAAIMLVLWLGPVAILAAIDSDGVFATIAIFFSQMAVVTFGGAYAVLAYVAQAAVESYHWLTATEMLDGLGLAETTPGPLIMVTQFVGFVGAYRDPGPLPPLLAGTLGGLLTTWVTFVPCFVWIFLGAPFIERLRANLALAGALSAVTAAVVGVILNLALWFALHFLFAEVRETRVGPLAIETPDPGTLDPLALILAGLALLLVFRFRLGLIRVLAASAAAGLVTRGLLGL
jgi:chromate transporter